MQKEMKTLVKALVLGALMIGAYVAPVMAQCDSDEKRAQYDVFVANRRGKTIESRSMAVEAGKKVLELCKDSTEAGDKEIVDYINKDLPRIEKWIADQTRFATFNDAGKAKRHEEAIAVAKEILALEPAESKIALDLQLYIASAALEVAAKKGGSNPYWGEALSFSKTVISSIESGKNSEGAWGAFEMSYKQGDPAASRNNALAWMNRTAGFAAKGVNDSKGAAEYFFKTSQTVGAPDALKAESFSEIGMYYLREALRLQEEIKKKFDSKEDAQIEEGKKQLAIAKGYAERGLDAFGRADEIYIKLNRTKDSQGLVDIMKGLYSFRSGGKTEGQTEFVANLLKGAFPSPSTEPTPIEEEPAPEPAPATTTTTTTTNGN